MAAVWLVWCCCLVLGMELHTGKSHCGASIRADDAHYGRVCFSAPADVVQDYTSDITYQISSMPRKLAVMAAFAGLMAAFAEHDFA